MSDLNEFLERLDRGIASVERELSRKHASGPERETRGPERHNVLRAVILPALVVAGLIAAIWAATR